MQVEICIDSGANEDSCHKQVVDVQELGSTEEGWKNMDPALKYKLVKKYWKSQGYPHIYWTTLE